MQKRLESEAKEWWQCRECGAVSKYTKLNEIQMQCNECGQVYWIPKKVKK